MRTNTQDLVSVSQAARSFGRIVTEVADDGRIRVVIKKGVPAVAIVPVLLIFIFLQRYLVQGVEQSGFD